MDQSQLTLKWGGWLSQRRTRKPGEPDFYSWRGETSHSVDSPGASLPLLPGRELHSPLFLPSPIVANSFLTYTSIPFPFPLHPSSIFYPTTTHHRLFPIPTAYRG